MNKSESKQLHYFPKQLDEAVKKKFGDETECTSELNFFGDGNYRTVFKAEGEKKLQIDAYIEGFIAGNRELAERLENKELWIG